MGPDPGEADKVNNAETYSQGSVLTLGKLLASLIRRAGRPHRLHRRRGEPAAGKTELAPVTLSAPPAVTASAEILQFRTCT